MAERVLIAEDSDVIRVLLCTLLEECGLEIIEAPDGQAAIDGIREHRPDAVLMDVEMPHLDGYAVMREMQKDPELASIPVVFLTARSEPREMALALEAGGHDYLSKPFETPELLARVSAALRTKRMTDELRELNRELERQAGTDLLTGLHNRRSLDAHLMRAAAAASRHSRALALMLLDVDAFATVNEHYGHRCGDELLVAVAERLSARCRAEDVLGRWEGAEFMVITGEIDDPGAEIFAHALREAIVAAPFAVTGEEIALTASVGYAVWRGDSVEDLVRRADRGVAAAKAAGRNTVRGA